MRRAFPTVYDASGRDYELVDAGTGPLVGEGQIKDEMGKKHWVNLEHFTTEPPRDEDEDGDPFEGASLDDPNNPTVF